MKNLILALILILLSIQDIVAQTTISGKITDQKKQGIPGVNVYIKDSYDGASTGTDGTYSFYRK